MTRMSTSLVILGRPRIEAATPPIITNGTFPSRHQAMRSSRGAKGSRTGSLLDTVGPSYLVPARPDFHLVLGETVRPTEALCHVHERRKLSQFHGRRRKS